jgi:excisionase family DNA binding protein
LEKTVSDKFDRIESQLERLIALVGRMVDGDKPAADQRLTIKQVANRLNVSTDTVRNLDRCGKLPASRIGKGRGTLRFDPALVEQFEREAAGNPLPKVRHG